MSGTGEIIDGEPHIHCVLGREGNETISGHLHWAKIESWYVRIYFIRLP
jgi:predicted DNA-binding protein with PD1-like motif